jgi:hypothetical protein
VTGLATKRLDALGTALLAIADQRVDVSLGDPEVQALRGGTGEALSVYASGEHLADFSLHARDAQALQPTREERPDDRPGHHLGCGA